jgi:uncharacterized membrane protein
MAKMVQVDVSVDIEIAAAPADVAAVMFDPAREPEWMKTVTSVEVIDPALAPGARVRHTGSLMGQEFSWTTQVDAVHFPHLLTFNIVDGPFTGTLAYKIERVASGSRARIRSVGSSEKLGFLPASFVEAPMKSALNADLERLKGIVEQR